jgi:hypothetical protein
MYEYRNLPWMNNSFAVVGKDNYQSSVGVLEWCPSLQDAKETITLMNQDKGRFEDLNIEKWNNSTK